MFIANNGPETDHIRLTPDHVLALFAVDYESVVPNADEVRLALLNAYEKFEITHGIQSEDGDRPWWGKKRLESLSHKHVVELPYDFDIAVSLGAIHALLIEKEAVIMDAISDYSPIPGLPELTTPNPDPLV